MYPKPGFGMIKIDAEVRLHFSSSKDFSQSSDHVNAMLFMVRRVNGEASCEKSAMNLL